MSVSVDARGLACPQPVIATKKALESIKAGVVTTIVDNAAAKENVTKFAVANNCGVSIEEKAGHYFIKITKGMADGQQPTKEASLQGGTVYLVTKDTLGHGSEELGAVLTKAFFYTMLETEPFPKALLFINAGVKLAVDDSPVLDHLKALTDRGAQVMACGTCLDFYKLKERLAVGSVSNMYAILSEMTAAEKVITL